MPIREQSPKPACLPDQTHAKNYPVAPIPVALPRAASEDWYASIVTRRKDVRAQRIAAAHGTAVAHVIAVRETVEELGETEQVPSAPMGPAAKVARGLMAVPVAGAAVVAAVVTKVVAAPMRLACCTISLYRIQTQGGTLPIFLESCSKSRNECSA